MALKHLAVRTSTFTAAKGTLVLVPGALPARLKEMSIVMVSPQALTFGLGKPATLGTPATPKQFQNENMDAADSLTIAYTTWTVDPTTPVTFVRRWSSAIDNTGSVTWEFKNGLLLPAVGLILWNIALSVACDVNITIDE